MSQQRSPSLALRTRGRLACFTRPELKVERVSYPVMTPSAARGILEAVLWKPAIQWHIDRIDVLNPIEFTSFRRNEVSTRGPGPVAASINSGGAAPLYYADADRAQRNTVALRDVDYVIHAHFSMTEQAGPADNMTKFVDMFQRRTAKGQHFHQPYFGCREFVADVLPVEGSPPPIPDSRDLGIMLWDIEYSAKKKRPIFFAAQLANGSLSVPEDPDSTFNTGGN